MSGATSAIAMGTMAAGVGMSTVGTYNKSKADKAAYEYQADVQRANAQVADWQAQDAVMRGKTAESTHRLKTANLKGSQRAALAARGIALDEGSALDVLTTTDVMGEADALMIRDNAAKEAWALRQQGRGIRANAALLDYRADSESPLLSASSTLLTGAGSVASSWYSFRDKGVKGY